jgi:hypothetical protein
MTQILLGQSYYLRFDPNCGRRCSPIRRWGRCTPRVGCASMDTRSLCSMRCWRSQRRNGRCAWMNTSRSMRSSTKIISIIFPRCVCCRMREAAFRMIDMAKSRGCTVILCGADATDHYVEYLPRRGLLHARRRGGDADRIAGSIVGWGRDAGNYRSCVASPIHSASQHAVPISQTSINFPSLHGIWWMSKNIVRSG